MPWNPQRIEQKIGRCHRNGQKFHGEVVNDLIGGRGADLVVECSGAAALIASTVELIRKKGRICVVGLTGKSTIPFPWHRAIHLMSSGQLPASGALTSRRPLADWESAFKGIEAQQELEVLLIPEK